MLSHFGKGLHRSLVKSSVPGEAWGLRLIQKLAKDYSESFVSLPPVSFDEETGPPSGGFLLSFALRRGLVAGPSVTKLSQGSDDDVRLAVLQWLRRRGPPVSEACRNRLVREKRVRLFEDGRLRQIGASAALQEGAQLLLPRTAVAELQAPRSPPVKGVHPPPLHPSWKIELAFEAVHGSCMPHCPHSAPSRSTAPMFQRDSIMAPCRRHTLAY